MPSWTCEKCGCTINDEDDYSLHVQVNFHRATHDADKEEGKPLKTKLVKVGDRWEIVRT